MTFIAYNIYLDTLEICENKKVIDEMTEISKCVEELHCKITSTVYKKC